VSLGYKKTLAKLGQAPSKAAKSTEYRKTQGDDALVIYDGRCGRSGHTTVAPPLQIFHPIFDDFTNFVNDPSIQPTAEDLDKVYRFMGDLSYIYKKEDDYAYKVRQHIGRILGDSVIEGQMPDNSRPDGVIMMEIDEETIPIVYLELKREIGDGGCDPGSQLGLCMRRSWIHVTVGYNRIHRDPVFDF
jgi:hypothetical protein